jgi:hypothetical protein
MTLSTNKRRPVIIGPDTPSDPKETDLWINSTNNKIYRYNGSTWAVVSEAITEAFVTSASAYALSQATSQINSVIDSAPGALNTLNELAAALNDDQNFATNIINSLTSASVGLANYIGTASANIFQYTQDATMDLGASLSAVINSASVGAISESNTYTDNEISALTIYTDAEINLLEASLISTIDTASAAAVNSAQSYADSLTTSDIAEGSSLYFTNQRAIDAGSATYLTQSNATATYLPKSGGSITGNLEVDGTLVVTGSTAYVNVTEFKVNDPMVYLAGNSSANLVDIGFVGNYNDGSYAHTGLVKDATDGKWKFFSSVETEPSGTIAFEEAVYDAVTMGSASVQGVVSASAFIGDGSQLSGIDLSTKRDKLNTLTSVFGDYTLVLADKDRILEVSANSQPITITVPPESSVDFPVGTEITLLQVDGGEVSIAGSGTSVTVDATPGLKIRAQWGSATLIKRGSDLWVAIGDLKA